MPSNVISSMEELENLYETAHPLSIQKETNHLTPDYESWLSKSRFFALATQGDDGLDCSPRGDATGQVFELLDNRTLIFPDRRGNNRIDSLRNIVRNPSIALMFLIPGINEALRINGHAVISTDGELLKKFEVSGKLPKSVVYVEIDAVYFQCARAIIRSNLWNIDEQINSKDVPSAGSMLKSAKADFDADAYDKELPQRQASTLY